MTPQPKQSPSLIFLISVNSSVSTQLLKPQTTCHPGFVFLSPSITTPSAGPISPASQTSTSLGISHLLHVSPLIPIKYQPLFLKWISARTSWLVILPLLWSPVAFSYIVIASQIAGDGELSTSEIITLPFKITMASHCNSNSSPWPVGPHMPWPCSPLWPHFLLPFLHSQGRNAHWPISTHTQCSFRASEPLYLLFFCLQCFFPKLFHHHHNLQLLARSCSLPLTVFYVLITPVCCLITYFSSFSSHYI